ncbi:hypothetical protein ANCCEY_05107 [Ancylostoma ceylanicum]|uniref:Metallo-beta-lactamase domain-containing protein n=1 Tax=Ancylostoma ceylanicum TaxID=53326 RepID=A0A0D6LXA5_9BILA|nr:hypothetical protein ANCCEY_05107 [Ancylostoma ceylanicum]
MLPECRNEAITFQRNRLRNAMSRVYDVLNDASVDRVQSRDRREWSGEVIWTPGHTPDSLVLWYAYDQRLFIGDLFYRYADIMLSYEYTNIKDYEASLRKVISFVMKQREPKKLRYSSAKSDADNECLPAFKHFHRFILSVLAGTHIGFPLRIDEAEGWRFETRDKAMRVIIGRDIVKRLNQAREKAQQYR